MPSIQLNNQSGGQLVMSGGQYSGHICPVGGVQLVMDPRGSGYCYIGLSGGVTARSGGLLDGIPMPPGGPYFVPRLGTGFSGQPSVYAVCDPATSGALLFFEVF